MNIEKALQQKDHMRVRLQITVHDEAAKTLEKLSSISQMKIQHLCEQLLTELLLHDPGIRKLISSQPTRKNEKNATQKELNRTLSEASQKIETSHTVPQPKKEA